MDEAKWELDWLLKMQQSNGSVLNKVGTTGYEGTRPPSLDTTPRYYGAASTSSTVSAAASFALAAIQYKSLSDVSMQTYGTTLQNAAINAWNWAVANQNVNFINAGSFLSADTEIGSYDLLARKLSVATYLFALTGNATYKTFVDGNYETLNSVKPTSNFVYPYEQSYQDAVLYYAKTAGATPSVVTNIKNRFTTSVQTGDGNLKTFTDQNDAYRAYLADGNHNWGSNKIKNDQGNIFNSMIKNNLDVANETRYSEASLGYIHYIHGINPTGFSYLSNMSSLGAENSVQHLYGIWFGDGTAYSNNCIPGYLAGGANAQYQPDASYTGPVLAPPLNQPIQKSYKDWNVGYPQNSWQISEPAIYYQATYIRNLSKALGGITAPLADITTPSVPTGLAAANTLQTTMTLNWTICTDNVDVTAYEIYQGGTKIAESTTNTLLLTGLTPETAYTFTVKSKDRAGNISASSAVLNVTTFGEDTQAPTVPTGLTATEVVRTNFVLTWTASTDNIGVSAYEIYQNNIKIGESTTPLFYVNGLTANTTYSIIIKAKDLANNISASSTALSVTTTNAPVDDKILYDETVLANWTTAWSWASPIDISSTSPVKRGSVAAKVTYGAPNTGFAIGTGNSGEIPTTSIFTGSYSEGISFWAYAEGSNPVSINVFSYDDNFNESAKKLISVPVGTWTLFNIPWSNLGNPAKVGDLVFQEGIGLSGKVVNFDDIRFIDKPYTLATTEVIYGDAMNSGWASYSSSSMDLNNITANTVKVGTKSINAAPTGAWQYFLASSSTVLNPANSPGGIGFWALGTTTNGSNTKVKIAVQTKNSTGISTQEKQVELTKDIWTYVNVSWTDLANPTEVKEIIIKDISGAEGQVYYLDDIKLLETAYVPPTLADNIVYDDAMNSGWASYSSSNFDLNNSTANTVKAGTKSIKAMPTGAYEYFLANTSTTLNPNNYPVGIGFWALGTTTNGTNTAVKIKVQTKTVAGTSSSEKQVDLPLGVWTYVNATWADLGNPSEVKEVVIQDISGAAGQVFYLDDIKLLAQLPTTVADVTFSPAGGRYTSAQTVSLATTTTGASIRYTTDGSIPTETIGIIYSTSISVVNTTTVKAIAFKSGSASSAITSATYTINIPVVSDVIFSLVGGTFTAPKKVKLSTSTVEATIRYTLDGTTPTEAIGTIYTDSIAVGSGTTTIKALAYKSGSITSAVKSETYIVNFPSVSNVVFSPSGGTFTESKYVTLSSATSGAIIRYTEDILLQL